MFFLKKTASLFFLLCFVVMFFIPITTNAQTSPETNPLCWSKNDCKKAIEGRKWKWDEKKNFLLGGPNNVCGSSLGACLPAGQADAAISIGGKVQFSDLGDYIKTIYIWAIGVGGTIAVILIIIGGFIYMTSGGSPDKIKSAKQRISGALLGLFLLLGSYTLLYTINPDLVRLRLPQAYMLRTITLGNEWCKDLPVGTKLVFKSDRISSTQVDPSSFLIDNRPVINNPAMIPSLINQGKVPLCGFRYFWPNSNDQTCVGHICELSSKGVSRLCLKEGEKYNCKEGVLSGSITSSDSTIPYPFIDNNLEIWAICGSHKNALHSNVRIDAEEEVKGSKQKYIFFEKPTASMGDCLPDKLGYFLVGEINDEGTIGGVDDRMPIGKSADGKCSVNLFKQIGHKMTQDFVGVADLQILLDKFDDIKDFLITKTELDGGLLCDIDLTRSEFPDR